MRSVVVVHREPADIRLGDWVAPDDAPDELWQVWAETENRYMVWIVNGRIHRKISKSDLTRKEHP